MKTVDGINEKNLFIRCVVFDLDDVLVNCAVEKRVDSAMAVKLLEKLSELERNLPANAFTLALVSGRAAEIGKKKLEESGFSRFFKLENVFFVSQDYLDSMAEVDRERYNANVAKDAFFQDDFFKQKALEKIIALHGIEKNSVVFVGHDLLTDAYYSQRFSGVQCALVKNALSLRHVPANHVVKGMLFVNIGWKDFRSLLLGKQPQTDYSFLRRFIENYLARELVGDTPLAAGLLGKAKLAKREKQNN